LAGKGVPGMKVMYTAMSARMFMLFSCDGHNSW